jgi:hypothetical protein
MANKKSQPEVKRGPGRPKAAPNEPDYRNHMVRVAQEIPDMIGKMAADRGMTRGVFVTTLIREAAARSAASRKAAATRAKAKA